MSTATATKPATTINVQSMGIQEFEDALKAGTMKTKEVLDILDARIAKRAAAGKSPIAKVIAFRNELAEAWAATTGSALSLVPLPQFKAKALPSGTLPSDPEELADLVFATVGPVECGKLIGRLTARIAGTPAK